jgi:hypothetical protein
VVVPFTVFVQVQLACGFHHGFEMGILGLFGGGSRLALRQARVSGDHGRAWRCCDGQLGEQATLEMGIDGGIIQIDGGENDMQQGFCTFQLALEGFNVLGGGISSTV